MRTVVALFEEEQNDLGVSQLPLLRHDSKDIFTVQSSPCFFNGILFSGKWLSLAYLKFPRLFSNPFKAVSFIISIATLWVVCTIPVLIFRAILISMPIVAWTLWNFPTFLSKVLDINLAFTVLLMVWHNVALCAWLSNYIWLSLLWSTLGYLTLWDLV